MDFSEKSGFRTSCPRRWVIFERTSCLTELDDLFSPQELEKDLGEIRIWCRQNNDIQWYPMTLYQNILKLMIADQKTWSQQDLATPSFAQAESLLLGLAECWTASWCRSVLPSCRSQRRWGIERIKLQNRMHLIFALMFVLDWSGWIWLEQLFNYSERLRQITLPQKKHALANRQVWNRKHEHFQVLRIGVAAWAVSKLPLVGNIGLSLGRTSLRVTHGNTLFIWSISKERIVRMRCTCYLNLSNKHCVCYMLAVCQAIDELEGLMEGSELNAQRTGRPSCCSEGQLENATICRETTGWRVVTRNSRVG